MDEIVIWTDLEKGDTKFTYTDLEKGDTEVGGVLQSHEHIVQINAVLEELNAQLLQPRHLELARLEVDLHHQKDNRGLVGVFVCKREDVISYQG